MPSENLVVAPVCCPLPNRPPGTPKLFGADRIRLLAASKAFEIYGQEEISEEYFCNYELNPAYRPRLEAAGLRFTGFGPQGEARLAELPTNHFFLASLFQPPLTSTPGKPHPMVSHYLRAAGHPTRRATNG